MWRSCPKLSTLVGLPPFWDFLQITLSSRVAICVVKLRRIFWLRGSTTEYVVSVYLLIENLWTNSQLVLSNWKQCYVIGFCCAFSCITQTVFNQEVTYQVLLVCKTLNEKGARYLEGYTNEFRFTLDLITVKLINSLYQLNKSFIGYKYETGLD